jgi:hypothetical protein
MVACLAVCDIQTNLCGFADEEQEGRQGGIGTPERVASHINAGERKFQGHLIADAFDGSRRAA